MHITRTAATAAAAALALVLGAPPAGADDYSDPAYLEFDANNLARATVQGNQLAQLTDPSYHAALLATAPETWLKNLGDQAAGLPHGRLYTGLGQLIPGGAVGNPKTYHELEPTQVSFVSRTGAELQGNLFWDGKPGAHPGVVITTGSIQGMQQSYWWAARTLARNGYLVLTWDAQGQGDSEGFGHQPGSPVPSADGFPSQQDANFDEGTIDALRFFLSTKDRPYIPGGWTRADADAVRAQGQDTIRWSNPLAFFLDRSRIGLAGHSLGAQAISRVQQCSSAGRVWRTLELCRGRSFPIRAVVAWDALSAAVKPVVPAMNQQADGYFLNPVPSPQAPEASEHLGAFRAWRAAGVDAYAFTVRGGTHLEWNEIPYILPSTTYGVRQVDYYTLAWFERYLGAFSFIDARGHRRTTGDLRAYAGLSPVGDWAGANSDRPTERAATGGCTDPSSKDSQPPPPCHSQC